MADTIRTVAALQSLLADNTTGAISPQDIRDMLVSLADENLVKQTSGWKDMMSALAVAKLGGVNDPTWAAFRGDIYQYTFAVNDEVFVAFHVPHDIKPTSQALFHVHWTTNGTSTNTVKWQIDYTFANGHNQAAFPTQTSITMEEAASGIAYQHMITGDTDGPTINEPDGLIIIRLARITNGGTENTDTVFGLFVDLHYESDREATINRSPNFYA